MRSAIWGVALLVGVASGCGGTEGEGTPLTVDTAITTPTTWSPTSADCDVVVKGVVGVKAALTVQPGTQVCFEAKAGLIVEETGSLNATGTASGPISFSGTSATRGFWRGIGFLSVNNENRLVHTDFRHAGSTDTLCCGFFVGNENVSASVLVGDSSGSAQVTVQDSSFSQSGGHGLFLFPNGKLASFARNRFAGNELTPVTVPFPQATQLDTASVYGGAGTVNGQQWVRVMDPGGDLSTSVTFRKLEVPYGMGQGTTEAVFDVTGEVLIEAGVRMEFEANAGIAVREGGRLRAVGTAANRVTLTGRSQTKGFWKGLAFVSLGNELTQTDVSYGGSDDAFCCGFFEPGGPSTRANLVVGDTNLSGGLSLTDVTSTQSGNRGLSVLKGTVNESGSNDLTTGNTTANLFP